MTWTRRLRQKMRLANNSLRRHGCVEGCHVEHAPQDDSGDLFFVLHDDACPNLARIKATGVEKAKQMGWLPPDSAA